VLDDELVTTGVDGRPYLAAKMAAMRAHASQISPDGPFFVLAEKVGEEVFGIEYFRLVRGRPGPADGPDGRETDLFAGLS
jgi:N-acetyl-1-D-myo-inositol-2-amino-2-deoxy-alpha-D-glucopyranoside deacetylase